MVNGKGYKNFRDDSYDLVESEKITYSFFTSKKPNLFEYWFDACSKLTLVTMKVKIFDQLTLHIFVSIEQKFNSNIFSLKYD